MGFTAFHHIHLLLYCCIKRQQQQISEPLPWPQSAHSQVEGDGCAHREITDTLRDAGQCQGVGCRERGSVHSPWPEYLEGWGKMWSGKTSDETVATSLADLFIFKHRGKKKKQETKNCGRRD